MTKISQYSTDVNITGNDKWIGSDDQNFLITKNFTPNNLASYFNDNNVIDIGTSIRYRYQTLLPGETREQGTISFETEIGPQVNFSAITTFLIAKNTLKGNNVTNYLDFLVDGKVLLSKASNINTFGYYKITSIEPYIIDTNFFVVVVEFIEGNGFIYEDLDYLVSLVDKVEGSGGGAVWGAITGDIEDQTDLINYITTGYVPYVGATSSLNLGNYSLEVADLLGNYISVYGGGFFIGGSLGEFIQLDPVYGLSISDAFGNTQVASYGISTIAVNIGAANITYAGIGDGFVIPDKGGLGGTFAMLSDIPSTSNLQAVTGVGANTNIPIVVEDITLPTQIYSRLSKSGLYVYTNADQASLTPTSLLLQTGGTVNNYLTIQPGGSSRNCTFYLPIKANGNYVLATTADIPTVTGYVPYTGATANVDLGVYGLTSEFLQINTTPTTYTPGVGKLGWNDTDGTLEFQLKGGNVTLQIGQEQVIRVVNKTSPSINLLEANYQVCLISGAQGQRVSVRLAQANNNANSAGTIGIVTETINANQEGFITTSGQVKKINTTGSLQGETWTDGDVLYLSAVTAGAITNVKPAAPAHTVIVGYVEYAHAINGKIFVKIDNGYELEELHNVSITTPLDNQALVYETATTLWKNKTLVEDSITNGVTDKSPSQNAVFDALALKQDKIIKQGYTQLTGVTGVNVLASLLIPADWIASGDGIEIVITLNKSVTASAITFAVYHDTTVNGTSNGIATNLQLTSAQRNGYGQRFLVLDSTTLRNSMNVGSTSLIPTIISVIGATTAFTPTVANYITITVNPTVISDVTGFNQFYIRKL